MNVEQLEVERLDLVVNPPTPVYHIRNAHWATDERTAIFCEFHYPDKRVLAACVNADFADGIAKNPDWLRIMDEFSLEEIEKNTAAMNAERAEKARLAEEAHAAALKKSSDDQLLAMKLQALEEVPLIVASKNQALKKQLRAATTIIEVFAYSTLIIQDQLAVLNQ